MAIVTASGTRIFVGAAVSIAAADSLAEFVAFSAWTEITPVESIGAFGDSANDVTFSAIGDSRVRHAKGARDAGRFDLVVAHDPIDAGQLALDAAQATNSQYAFRVELPDAPGPTYTGSVLYFRALVAGNPLNIGTNDNVIRKTYSIGLQSEVFAQAPIST